MIFNQPICTPTQVGVGRRRTHSQGNERGEEVAGDPWLVYCNVCLCTLGDVSVVLSSSKSEG